MTDLNTIIPYDGLNTIIPYDGYLHITCRMDDYPVETKRLNVDGPASNSYYARVTIGRICEEAEPMIVTDPEWACWYACNLLRHRWKKAEPVIKDSVFWNYYAKHFDIKE